MLPNIPFPNQTKETIQTFGGYNHNISIAGNEFFDMKNLSSSNYPTLSPRPKRGIVKELSECNGLISKDKLAYIEGNVLHYGDDVTMELDSTIEGERQLVSMGAYIIVYPDMMYLNTTDTADRGNCYGEIQTFAGVCEVRVVDSNGIKINYDDVIFDGYINSTEDTNLFWAKGYSEYDQRYIFIDPTDTNTQIVYGIPASGAASRIGETDYTRTTEYQNATAREIEIATEWDSFYIKVIDPDSLVNHAQSWFTENNNKPMPIAKVNVTRVFYGQPMTRTYVIAIQPGYKADLQTIKVGDLRVREVNNVTRMERCKERLDDSLKTFNSDDCWQEVPSYVRLKITNSDIGIRARAIIDEKLSDALHILTISTGNEEIDGYIFNTLYDKYALGQYSMLKDNVKVNSYDSIDIAGCLSVTDQYPLQISTEFQYVPVYKKLDFIIESNNRLWGCRYGKDVRGNFVNEIYATAQGSFKQWDVFEGTSMDSYAVSVGSDGEFTGAVNYGGRPMFFKENCCHVIYGSYPSSYQVVTDTIQGVQKGSHKSLCVIQNTLYYKARDGIYRNDGASYGKISDALGIEAYDTACAGSIDNKYYICMKDERGAYSLFVYDIAKGMWHKEDNISVTAMVRHNQDLYVYDKASKKLLTVKGTAGVKEASKVKWMAETGNIGYTMLDAKYLDKIRLRIELPQGSTIRASVEYDSNGYYEYIGDVTGKSSQAFSLPLTPRRCDHFKLRLEGEGECKIFSLEKILEEGGDW